MLINLWVSCLFQTVGVGVINHHLKSRKDVIDETQNWVHRSFTRFAVWLIFTHFIFFRYLRFDLELDFINRQWAECENTSKPEMQWCDDWIFMKNVRHILIGMTAKRQRRRRRRRFPWNWLKREEQQRGLTTKVLSSFKLINHS